MELKQKVSLDDKYSLESGRVYITGTQALVKFPIIQRQRDKSNNLNTAENRSQISHSLKESSKRIGEIEFFAEETLSKLVFLNALENFRRTIYGGQSLADSFDKLVNESDFLKDERVLLTKINANN